MWISSFVVTLSPTSTARHPVSDALEALPVFTLGEQQGARLPVVLETPDGSTARYWHEWVERLPGVVQVEVAFVSFDESDQAIGAAVRPMAEPAARSELEPALGTEDDWHG